MKSVDIACLSGALLTQMLSSDGAAQLYQIYASSFSPEQTETWSRKGFDEVLALDGVGVFVAQGEGALEAAGLAITRQVLDEAELLAICVKPSWREKGVARATMQNVGLALKKDGVARIYLEVRESNKAAIRLYEACGYSLSGRRKGYYGDNSGLPTCEREDALLFDKRLMPDIDK